MRHCSGAPANVSGDNFEGVRFFFSLRSYLDFTWCEHDRETGQWMSVHICRFTRSQRQTISAYTFIFENGIAPSLFWQLREVLQKAGRLENFDRQVTKRRGPNINRAMNICRLAKSDVAELPWDLSRCSAYGLDPEAGAAHCDDDVVVAMNMPERHIASRHCNIPDPHEFIFKFRVMTRLAADFNRRLRRVGLRQCAGWNRESEKDDKQK